MNLNQKDKDMCFKNISSVKTIQILKSIFVLIPRFLEINWYLYCRGEVVERQVFLVVVNGLHVVVVLASFF